MGRRKDDRMRSVTYRGIFRSGVFLLCLLAVLGMVSSCGNKEEKSDQPESYEIVLVADANDVNENSFTAAAWDAIQSFCGEYDKTCRAIKANTDGDVEEINASCKKAVDKAISQGGKVVVFAGSQFDTIVHDFQTEYEDTFFILIDGVPRDKDYNYKMAPNSTGVLFAEEQAGFLAGYAAVADGYRKIGFFGGRDIPPVKRYGYGFIQGCSQAARDLSAAGVELRYLYTGTFDGNDGIKKEAQDWYGSGTEIIFACGGSIGNSVVKAAEYSKGRVIGVDTDQSALSETVVTSARKEIKTAIYDILKTYIHDNFKGNSIFTYSVENNGISLEMTNARFNSFGPSQYDKVLKEIKDGKINIDKEMGTRSVEDLAPDNIKVTESTISDSQD